jgi:hypothetical protein
MFIGDHPKLKLTDEEKRIFTILFKQADTKNDGIVTGEVAITLFPRAKLSENILGEVRACMLELTMVELTSDRFGQCQIRKTAASCCKKTLQKLYV